MIHSQSCFPINLCCKASLATRKGTLGQTCCNYPHRGSFAPLERLGFSPSSNPQRADRVVIEAIHWGRYILPV
jgi:hypothetical protein